MNRTRVGSPIVRSAHSRLRYVSISLRDGDHQPTGQRQALGSWMLRRSRRYNACGSMSMAGQRTQARGFTLVEATISIVLVGVLLVAALNTMGAAKIGEYNTVARGRAHLLAEDLMAEIMRHSYADPETVGFVDLTDPALVPSGLTVDPGESGGIRADFDDVDDYNGWTASPPEQTDGTTIPNLTGWGRSVSVERLDPATHLLELTNELGLKRITVTVSRDNVQVAELVAFKGAGLPP